MFLTALLAAACLTSTLAPTQGRTPAPPSGGNTSEATAEGIEILRRLVVDSLDNAFETKKSKTDALTTRPGFQVNGMVTTLWAGGQTIQHARAFHMPDVGLFFAFDASLPVVSKDEKKEAGKPDQAPSNDEWERARREVRGAWSSDGGVMRGRFFVQPKEAGEIDPKAIDQTIDVLLRTLARHVGRIEGLGASESVTIALRLSGKNESWLHDFTNDEPSEPGEEGDEGDEGSEHALKSYSTFVLSTGQEVREQNLVIHVALADLLGAGENGLDRLRSRAQINRY
jgi:hypothetical protein